MFIRLEDHASCAYDYLTFFDGEKKCGVGRPESPSPGGRRMRRRRTLLDDIVVKGIGQNSPPFIGKSYVRSAGSAPVVLDFRTDGSVTSQGFRLTCGAPPSPPPPPPPPPPPSPTTPGCHVTRGLTTSIDIAADGAIRSINYPRGNYTNYIDDGDILINGPAEVMFTHFDLEQCGPSGSCSCDFLEMNSTGGGQRRMCGAAAARPSGGDIEEGLISSSLPNISLPVLGTRYTIPGGESWNVYFRTDHSIVKSGFQFYCGIPSPPPPPSPPPNLPPPPPPPPPPPR